jgi:hypothetical protein
VSNQSLSTVVFRQEFFENYGGAFRDQLLSIWQIFVLFENAQTYPASLPLPLTKAMFKIGSLIGQLLGFKVEYEEYTTITNEYVYLKLHVYKHFLFFKILTVAIDKKK